jgi:hypothetical protein
MGDVMSDETIRQQAQAARAQAVATIASIDALIATLPPPQPAPKRGPRTLGDDETGA